MKTIVAMAIGALLFGGGLIGGLLLQNYFYASQQSAPPGFEQLTVQSYVSRPFTKLGIEFALKNTGTTGLQIVAVTMNGHLNQSTIGLSQGWNGTTVLSPSQTGSVFVYYPCYVLAFNDSMPELSSNPTQAEFSNVEQWVSSFNCTFTFLTNAGHNYNYTMNRLGFDLYTALAFYESTFTYTFTATEQVHITNMNFQVGDATHGSIQIIANNTGTSAVTINEAWVNNLKQTTIVTVPAGGLPAGIAANTGLVVNMTLSITQGYSYQVKLISSKGNTFLYTATAPS
jgi:hypothetical protein